MYSNWEGPVKVPSVCQYAHKKAYQAGMNGVIEVKESLMKKPYFL